ncbi:MAG: indolepyruvate ferredoxin oxidoreductase [Phycisphaerae bacterium]|nr:indolepyruvate ferredoxin oxidoreductase [Phycisphaerae bacterium]
MKTEILLGDEAIALGALHAGIAGVFSYPGTPATEILEYLAKWNQGSQAGNGRKPVVADWSANEKVAYEEALGMSYAGKRALVSMKHVGLNVAADPFINSALTGANGGLVLVVADDPGMHSSQNEQDSRFYAQFAQIPVYEPSDQQEAYYMTLEAFEQSERLGLPIMIRLVTRLAHSRGNVKVLEHGKNEVTVGVVGNPSDWTLMPANARRRFQRLVDAGPKLQSLAEESTHNVLKLAGRKGIICSGIAYGYVLENVGPATDFSILRITQYPLPVNKIRQLVEHCDEITVMEDGYPFIESQLRGVLQIPGKAINGKHTGHLPMTGELTPELVRKALGMELHKSRVQESDLGSRPPRLCTGCPHIDSYNALVEVLESYPNAVVFGDIGCYTLGALPPYSAIQSCVDMGASIGMARGAALGGVHPSCVVIGDSTFTHSGLSGLLGAANHNTNMTVFILDNSTVAMTGGQEALIGGDKFIQLVKGLGVDPEHLRTIVPLPKSHEKNVRIIREEIEHKGLSVIISARACIQIRKPGAKK